VAQHSQVLSQWAAEGGGATSWVRDAYDVAQARPGRSEIAEVALGQPLGQPPDAVLAALARAVAERWPGRFAYMPNLGYPELRERAALECGLPGLGADCVAITAGASGALTVALRAFADPGTEALAIAPLFPEYSLYCRAAGVRLVSVRSRPDFSLDLGALEGALTERTRVLFLNTPNNPTGRVLSDPELAELAELLELHAGRTGRHVVVLADEVYRKVVYTGRRAATALSHYPATAVARSFSKDLGLAGERIGYLALHPELARGSAMAGVKFAQRAAGFVNASATMQRMLLFLDSWEVDVSEHLRRRDHAVERCRSAGLAVGPPDAGLYLFFRVPAPDPDAFTVALNERNVFVAPGRGFGAPDHVRICFTSRIEAVERAIDVIGELAMSGAPTI
jgi:aspartate aminotransferase